MWRTSLHTPEELLHPQGSLWWAWKIKKVRQCQHSSHLQFCCGEHPCKFTTWCMIFLRSYCIHKAIWLRARLKVQKGWKKVNIKFGWNSDKENIVLCKGTTWYWRQKLSHSQEVGCHTPSFDHDLLQKVKGQRKVSIKLVEDFDVENKYNIFIHIFYTKMVKYLN